MHTQSSVDMSVKRKNSELSSSTCKLLNVDNDSDEEYNYEDCTIATGNNGNFTKGDNEDNDEEDDEMYDADYFKYLEADVFDNNSFLSETTLLDTSFSNKQLLSKAVPGTRKYRQIISSTAALAAKVLTKNFKVVNFQCVFMEPNTNKFNSFCIKTNKKN